MKVRRRLAVVLAAALLLLPAASVLASPPSNDTFAHAVVVGSLPFTGHTNNTSATIQSGEPTPSCYSGTDFDNSIWWRYAAVSKVNLVASADDAFVAVYQGTSLASLTELACGGFGANLNFTAQAGQTIYFQVGGSPGSGGAQTLTLKKL